MQPEWSHASPGQRPTQLPVVAPSAALARSDVDFDSALDVDSGLDFDRPARGPDVDASDPVRRRRRAPARLSRHLKAALVAADVLTTLCGLAAATAIVLLVESVDHAARAMIWTAVASLPFWPVLYAHQGLYQARRVARRLEEVRRIVNSALSGLLVLAGISVLASATVPRMWFVCVGLFVALAMIAERELVRRLIYRLRAKGLLTRRVIVVGDNEEATEVATSLSEHPELGYEVIGYAAESAGGRVAADLGPYLGRPTDVLDLVHHTGATGVIMATTGIDQEIANRLTRDLTRDGLFAELTSAMRDISSTRISVRPLGPYPIMCVEPVAQVSWRSAAKRTFDIVVATLLLILSAPLVGVCAVLIRCSTGPDVMFRQQRVGKDGRLFRLYKLRTMVPDAEELLIDLRDRNEAPGPMFKMADDPRVTPIGRFLRATSIDELPQLVNVLLGDMSLVGPRPALVEEARQWDEQLRERLRVRPGITGMWQVSGRYTASLETYARLDLYYVDNWSLVTDVAIMARTVWVVLRRHGAA